MQRQRGWCQASVLATCLVLAGGLGAQEVLDHRIESLAEGSTAAGTVQVSFREAGGGEAPHAVVVARRGSDGAATTVAGFGLWAEEGRTVMGLVSATRLEELREVPAGSLQVTVDAEKLAATIEALSDVTRARKELSPEAVWDNLIYRLIPILELEAPYRGGFGPGDPYGLARDLTRLNRPR